MSTKYIYASSNFTLSLLQLDNKTSLEMQILGSVVNTRHFPQTIKFLQKNFPEVLGTECFNEGNLPFMVEVQATEIGHLFEHILIEDICNAKVNAGYKKVIVNGNTSWNWNKDPEGLFHIVLDTGRRDFKFLVNSLEKAIFLTENLFASHLPKTTSDHLFSPQPLLLQ